MKPMFLNKLFSLLTLMSLYILVGCNGGGGGGGDSSGAGSTPPPNTSTDTSGDNTGPSSVSISISSAAITASSTAVTLNLFAIGASEMFVTNTAGCTSSGSYEPYSTSRSWILGQENGTATVFVKYKDSAGNESSCISDSIIHDNIAPTSTSISINSGDSTTTSTTVTLSLSATGASEMYVTNTPGCSSGGSYEQFSNTKPWTLGQTNSTATVFVKFKDSAGNESSCISDTINPNIPPPDADPLYAHAWYLKNTGQSSFSFAAGTSGADINYDNLRSTSINGSGVKFAISDGGIDTDHPDLESNYRQTDSKNFLSSNPYNGAPIVSPNDPDDNHGTAVTGIINAVAYNGIGSMGISHGGTFGGFNYLAKGVSQDTTKTLMQMDGNYDVFNYSYGSSPCWPVSLGSERTSLINGYKNGVENLRGGKGAIYVKSAGNEFSLDVADSQTGCGYTGTWVDTIRGNSTLLESNNYPYTIIAGAVNAFGEKSSYSSPGSNIWVSAPGGESGYDFDPTPYGIELITATPAIVTTDIAGCNNGYSRSDSWENDFENGHSLNQNCDYTSVMNGTSSAAPVVSGVVGLILQANPELGWRDVKHILASTAQIIDGYTGSYPHPDGYDLSGHVYQQGWVQNAAGYWFHNYYGFGMVDAEAAVEMALAYDEYLGTFVETNWTHNSGSLSLSIPDNNASGVLDTISVSNNLIIESVQIKVSATHYTAENLGIELTSPSGTKSIILNINSGILNSDLANDIFSSNAFYGENAQGSWTIKVIDGSSIDPDGLDGTTGTLTNWQLNFYGHSPDTSPPSSTSIAINSGDSITNSTSVSLSLAATGVSEMYITNTAGCASGGTYEAYSTSKSWTLGQTNTTATVYVKYKDSAGNESICISDTIIHDNIAPTSTSISINSGDSITNSTSASLSLAATGATEMYVTNVAGCGSGGTYEAYSASKSWILMQTNSTATVYVKYKDSAGNESSCISDTILNDNIAPTSTSISINSDDSITTSTAVTLRLSATGASEMYITNVAGCESGGTYEAYSTSKPWSLGQTNTTATVYVKFKDAAGNESTCINDTISHSNTAPTATSISINSGDSTTTSTAVTLGLSATGASEMYITNTAGCATGGTYEAYSTSKPWSLGQTNTSATVYVKYKDSAGNESSCISDTIIHDNIAPTSTSISINSDDSTTTSTAVTLGLSATGASEMYITNTAGCASGGTYEAYSTSKSWSLGQTNTTATVYVKYKDDAGNESSCISDTIIHDNIAPSSTSISINSDDSTTTSTAVTLGLSATGASEMYVTNVAGCGSGGTYEAYSTSKSWSLGQTNSTATVYVKYKDSAGNESSCISDTIVHDNISPSSSSMIFTIETTSPNETFTLPFRSGYNYNVDVNWGDGSLDDTITVYNQAEATHTFTNAGIYTITLSGLAEAWYFNNTSTSKDKIRTVVQLGDLGWIDLSNAFYGCSNLTSFTSENTDTSSVTDMSNMFEGASSLTSLNLSSFNTSSVTNMSNMFYNATSLTSLDLSNFNTSSVTDMSGMFYGAPSSFTSLNVSSFDTSSVTDMSFMFTGATSLTSLNLSNFDTSSVTDMSSMFYGASSLTSLNLSNFDTSSVTDMNRMFFYASGLTSLNLSSFNTLSVTDMRYMFYGASSLTSLNLSSFETSSVIEMTGMFYGASSLTSLDLSGFDTSSVTDMSYMFYGASGLTSLDLSNFDTSSVTNMSYIFSNASSLTSLNLSSFDTSSVTDMRVMFSNASSLTSLNLSSFNTSSVTDMSAMFYGASSLTSLNVSSFDTSSVTKMSGMFNYASSLTSLNLSNFNTSSVTSMSYMFYGASSLTSLNLSNFNTSSVTSMSYMFYGASSLTSLNLSNFNTSSVTSMSYMFYGASGLTSLDLSNFDTSSVTDMNRMFYNASGLTSLNLSSFNTSSVTNMSYMFYGASSLTSLDLSGFDTSSVTDMSYMFSNASSLTSLDLSNWDTNPRPLNNNWILGMTGTIICNDPDSGGVGAAGTGTVNGTSCN